MRRSILSPQVCGMTLRMVLLATLAILTGGGARAAQPTPAADPATVVLNELNQVSLDPSQIYDLRGKQITRDRIHLYFHRGFIGFYKKVDGEITGAVFEGEGEILLMPPDVAEKSSLLRFTGSPILEEQFHSVLMRFSDKIGQELLAESEKPDPDDPEQPNGFFDRWNPVVLKLASRDALRILEDLIGRRDLPYFDARIEGLHLGTFDVEDDERLEEPIVVAGPSQQGAGAPLDIWCSFASRAAERRQAAKVQTEPARALSYKINTKINSDDSLEGQTVVNLRSQSSADRILKFEISAGLRVTGVRDAAGKPLNFLQQPAGPQVYRWLEPEDWLDVLLPAVEPAGASYQLQINYSGHVIADLGNGVFFVGSHGSWYPNLPDQWASFDLTFQFPDSLTLVATGNRVEASSSQGWKHSRWVSDGQFPVAGFNLGVYDSRTRQAGATKIEVYATGAVEASLQQRYEEALLHNHQAKKQPAKSPKDSASPSAAPKLDPAALLDLVSARAAGAVEYFDQLFGPLPYSHLAIAEIPGDLGQGWPGLVYLPTISFLPKAERSELGIKSESGQLFASGVVAHEIAHQWWGNEVGWKSYHDIWLSEGMATFASALFMAQEEGGENTMQNILQAYKKELLATGKNGKTVESAGPIWLGWRLSTSADTQDYDDIVYKKSCWVLQMLRMILTDPSTGSDAKFFRFLHDFVADYRGRSPSTQDFARFAARYMTPQDDLDQDHTLNWFFNEWVHSTGVPTYTLKQRISRLASGEYVATGSITQSGVSQDFEMLVPMIAVGSGGRVTRLAPVRMDSSSGTFRFVLREKPAKVEIDENNILATIQ